jgi:hypothetical protein
MVNLIDAPADAVTRAEVQAPAWAAFSPVTVSGLPACAEGACVMPSNAGLLDRDPAAGEGRSLPRVSPAAHLHLPIQGRPSTRKPYENTTRTAGFGGGAKGPHPLREPEPV